MTEPSRYYMYGQLGVGGDRQLIANFLVALFNNPLLIRPKTDVLIQLNIRNFNNRATVHYDGCRTIKNMPDPAHQQPRRCVTNELLDKFSSNMAFLPSPIARILLNSFADFLGRQKKTTTIFGTRLM